jgi:hypothetical protein
MDSEGRQRLFLAAADARPSRRTLSSVAKKRLKQGTRNLGDAGASQDASFEQILASRK